MLNRKEAGAKLTDFKGNAIQNDKESVFFVSNGTGIHSKLLEILKEES